MTLLNVSLFWYRVLYRLVGCLCCLARAQSVRHGHVSVVTDPSVIGRWQFARPGLSHAQCRLGPRRPSSRHHQAVTDQLPAVSPRRQGPRSAELHFSSRSVSGRLRALRRRRREEGAAAGWQRFAGDYDDDDDG